MSRCLIPNPLGDYHSPISSTWYETNLSECLCQTFIDQKVEHCREIEHWDWSEAQMLLLLAERKLNNNVPFPLVNRDESKLNLDKSAFSPFSFRKKTETVFTALPFVLQALL